MKLPAPRPLLLAACLLVPVWGCGGSSPSTPSTSQSSPSPSPTATTSPVSLDDMLADKVLGSATAPVAIIEYSSLTCPHCASFHRDTLPQLRAAYIEVNRARLVYRDFPLDPAALSAAMIARCSGPRYFSVLELLFAKQNAWAWSADTVGALKQAVSADMAAAEVDACLANSELRAGILRIQEAGRSEHKVGATPTFIIGSQTLVGAYPFSTFDAILKGL